MIEADLEVKNKDGLHIRAAALFVQIASKYKSNVTVIKDGNTANGRSILELLTLFAEQGSVLHIIVDGEDEKQLLDEIKELIEGNFEEG
jgi:phosphocarrier protein